MAQSARRQVRPGDSGVIALPESVGAHVATTFVGAGLFRCPKSNVRWKSLTVRADGEAYTLQPFRLEGRRSPVLRRAAAQGREGPQVMNEEKIAPFIRNRRDAKVSNWRDRFTLTKLADIVPDDDPLWLIDGLIPAGPSLGVISGQPKSGKSFLTADMFLHVAMGRAYAGCTVQQGAVVYITKEGVRGFKRRMMTARQHHSAGSQVPLYVAHEMPNFGADKGTPTPSLR